MSVFKSKLYIVEKKIIKLKMEIEKSLRMLFWETERWKTLKIRDTEDRNRNSNVLFIQFLKKRRWQIIYKETETETLLNWKIHVTLSHQVLKKNFPPGIVVVKPHYGEDEIS